MGQIMSAPYRLTMRTRDGGQETIGISAASDDKAVQEALQEVRAFSSLFDARLRTVWVSVDWELIKAGGELVGGGCEKLAVDPNEPKCVEHDTAHEWEAPHAVVGGMKSNPGVQGKGGGITYVEVCSLCALTCHTDTWAQDPEDGEEGLRSIRYSDEYTDAAREYYTGHKEGQS